MNSDDTPPLSPERASRFVDLLTSHQRKLHAYICTLMLGDAAAADVLQDTNIDLWAKIGEYDFGRPFLPWAFSFARQRVMAFRKSQSRSRLLFSEAAMARIEEECSRLAEEADTRMAALQNCLKKLNERQRYLIDERYDARTSVKMLAARLGESAHNVASQLHRIRASLARCIDVTLAAEERA
ncbi:RNA polymerase sigma factor [Bythopirellula goksoeyrii]|uniref:RNA polymerase sigma factor n=1 Tax=Bythopirellula goksoeyrii TaxID=1400387 RepID=A0A5B9QE62_9BACT|nr:RNA polymerase sigma factor [Bythopirellula goksoeyrii]